MQKGLNGLDATHVPMSSGLTFRTSDWHELGNLGQGLCSDFVDHVWCFRAQAPGLKLFEHPGVVLCRHIGMAHLNLLSRLLDVRFYGPGRHLYGLGLVRFVYVVACFLPSNRRRIPGLVVP